MICYFSISLISIVLSNFSFYFRKSLCSKHERRCDSSVWHCDFNLTCHFVGTPVPMVEWWFNGDPVYQVSVLTVKKFQPSRVGVYQCLVSNQYGADIGSAITFEGSTNVNLLLSY